MHYAYYYTMSVLTAFHGETPTTNTQQ